MAFGSREVFRGLECAFPGCRISWVLGGSGSGKSTILIHQSFGDLIGEWHIQATRDVDGRELRLLEGPVARELLSLARQVGPAPCRPGS
jgi:ABC-type transporter Mla maintaining outer membrane lipid asymmetry ATPase subunit MlaF